jgi:FkbM family methyltransferase
MSLTVRILGWLYGGRLARLWHRLAPSVTVSRRVLGMRLYFDSRDNISALVLPASVLETHEWPLLELPKHVDGPVWDVGSNIGLLTLAAAARGRTVTAFDMSSRAAELLRRSRDANGFDFEVVARGFATTEMSYRAPATSYPGNRLSLSEAGAERTITYTEAEEQYGTPALVKMDIEGMEEDFFTSPGFKRWICDRNVVFFVEVHSALLGHTPTWEDVPHIDLEGGHFLYCADVALLDRLLASLGVAERT